MRQNQRYPLFTENIKKHAISLGLLLLLSVITTGSAGCKKKASIEIPESILQAKSATLNELLEIVNRLDEIQTARVSNLKAEYTSEKKEGSLIELEKYPKAPGYILLKRPDSTYLVIQNPVIKKREISLLSEGDEFRVWIHGRREFYIGKNSSKDLVSEELEKNPEIPIRAVHIFEAIFPRAIPMEDPDVLYTKIEEEDAHAKYYVLTLYRYESSPRIRPLREFRIERAGLTITRQRIFDDTGQIISKIAYSNPERIDKYTLPRKIHIERPLDGYTLDLEFKDWVINPVFKDTTFSLEPVEGVKVIRFK